MAPGFVGRVMRQCQLGRAEFAARHGGAVSGSPNRAIPATTRQKNPAVTSPAVIGARIVNSGWAWRRTAVVIAADLIRQLQGVRPGSRTGSGSHMIATPVRNG